MKNILFCLLFAFLFTGCVTEKRAQSFYDKNTDKLASYVDTNTDYINRYGAIFADKHFPTKIAPPDTIRETITVPGKEIPCPPPVKKPDGSLKAGTVKCPDCSYTKEVIIKEVENTRKIEAANAVLNATKDELKAERAAHEQTKAVLKDAEDKSDAWRSKARVRWFIIAGMVLLTIGAVFVKFVRPRFL